VAAPADDLISDFGRQVEVLGDRVPAYQRVLARVAELLSDPQAGVPLGAAFSRAWSRRHFSAFYERPLLLLAALRYDALLDGDGAAHPLWRAIGEVEPDETAVTREAVAESLASNRLGFWLTLRTRRVQTNEVSRAVTWLWPMALAGAADGKRPLALVDVGASAGLNLIADSLALSFTNQYGETLPTVRSIHATTRLGFDVRPLDVRNYDDRRWLRACVWPGEQARLELLDRAVEVFEHAMPRVELETLTASAVPARLDLLSSSAPPGSLVVAYQTLLEGYLRASEHESYTALMHEWLAGAPAGTAVWLKLEMGEEIEPIAPAQIVAVAATTTGVQTWTIARTGYHPRELIVDPAAARELKRALTPP
jgi:hypothetical protein